MDITGLINKTIALSNECWDAHQLLHETKENKQYGIILSELLQTLKDVGRHGDIPTLFVVEHMILSQERTRYANSPEEANSIKTALAQLEEAKSALSVVKNPDAYQTATATYSSKRMEAGLPLDAFREFLKSHSTRLTNRLTSPLSVPEKNILRQRKENLSVVKEIYMGLQREALGLPTLKKEQGLER